MKAILQWVLKTMMKDQTGIVKTMPKKDIVDFNVAMTAERLMRNGVDPNSLKNANQVENALNMIENRPKVQEGIKSTKSAKVFDMEGKEIPKGSKIMGGKAIDDDLPPPGSRGGKDDIAAPFQSADESLKDMMEAEIKKRLDKGNREGIARIRNKKMVKDAIDNVSPGFVKGDRKYNAQLVAEDLADKKFGKDFYDLNQRQQNDLYGEALDGLSVDLEDFAQGGRAGFANGTGAPSITLGPKEEPMGPRFETNDPGKAAKEIIRRLIKVEGAQIPLTKKGLLSLNIDNLDKQSLGGIIDLLGGHLQFGVGRDEKGKGAEFTFRKQFKDGSGMTRRTFLKILGGAMSIPIIGKFLKPFKTAKGVTKVPMIKTDNVPGKPEWFDQLVNKVIIEGDDVTKRFATAERQRIHQKTLDDGSVVRVTEDVDDGAVRVEYESETNVFGDPVQMQYKKPLPDEGDPRPKAEFTTAESGPVGRQQSPDDYDIEIDEVGGTSIRDLDSDVSKLKEYATGKGPTMREIVQNKKRRDKAQRITEDPESQMDAVIRRQGEMLDDDFSPDFASGGIARMLGE